MFLSMQISSLLLSVLYLGKWYAELLTAYLTWNSECTLVLATHSVPSSLNFHPLICLVSY
jgi:hypothetical protein